MTTNSSTVSRVRMHENGPEFSEIVWGSMRSESQFSSSDDLAEHLRWLYDRGVTTLDTAPAYGVPHPYTTEEFLGKAIAEVGRDKFEIVTKCGIQRISPHKPENRVRHFDFSEQEIRSSTDRSLQKLGIDVIDVMLLHRPDYLMDPDETAGALDELVAEGKVRYVGVSNLSPSRLDLLASRLEAPIVTNQIQFSPIYLNPIADGTFDLAIKTGHKPMIWSPVGGGRLLTRDDDYIAKVREKLSEIAKAYELDGPANAAISFVARHPANSVIVLGSGKQERIEGAIKAVNTELDRADWYDIVSMTHPSLFF
jgi:predicted oxidoreductase